MAVKKKIKLGDEIEGRCTKCKEVTNHTVTAIQDGEIKKVQCNVCESSHKYYPPKKKTEAKAVKKSKTSPQPAKTEDATRISPSLLTEWKNAVEEAAPDQFKPYLMTGVFQEKELIEHPKFGRGLVRKILSTGKMEVLFADGLRRMVFNRPTPEK
ncbi:MAG: hypothetical protein JXQ27_14895 [Acidobacteria bacterium]|nr:hypothetical protein [Acidobacteriota bacterium]